MRYLNLGCGIRFSKGSDWVNIDFISTDPSVSAHNLREGLPLPDNSVDLVYCSHLLEHFSKTVAPVFISECLRVLRPGGVLRVAVPDIEGIVRAYLKSLDESRQGLAGADERHDWMLIELLDQMVREQSGGEMLKYLSKVRIPAKEFIIERLGVEAKKIIEGVRASMNKDFVKAPRKKNIVGYLRDICTLSASAFKSGKDTKALEATFSSSGELHRWMYDSVSLKKILEEAGFTDIIRRTASESYIPDWASQHLDTEPDGSVYKPDSLFMEGLKP